MLSFMSSRPFNPPTQYPATDIEQNISDSGQMYQVSSQSLTNERHLAVARTLQLPKAIRDELVELYFRHVHPLCPMVDEYLFMDFYSRCSVAEEVFEKFHVMLFRAMMFMGFTVCYAALSTV